LAFISWSWSLRCAIISFLCCVKNESTSYFYEGHVPDSTIPTIFCIESSFIPPYLQYSQLYFRRWYNISLHIFLKIPNPTWNTAKACPLGQTIEIIDHYYFYGTDHTRTHFNLRLN
jgi:hypothetical protein